MQNTFTCPVIAADSLGAEHFKNVLNKEELGQFFTPVSIAGFMAKFLELPSKETIRVLDPGSGTGVLAAAAVKELVNKKSEILRAIELDLYEIDLDLKDKLISSMENLKDWCLSNGVLLNYVIYWDDFILSNGHSLNDQIIFDGNSKLYDIVISNPPYFKISKDDPRAKICNSIVHGQPNIYALFMGVSASILNSEGQFLFITPRSFASGQYFKLFREYFLKKINIKKVHQFSSRTNAFGRDHVLQENVIFYGMSGESHKYNPITVSTSFGKDDLTNSTSFTTSFSEVLINPTQKMIALPSDKFELDLLDLFKSWTNSIDKMGLKISTGPVVPFRSTNFLLEKENNKSVPLLWIQHISNLQVRFPLSSFRKQQWFSYKESSSKLLVKNQNMILMRRFSPKEDVRRLSVAPLFKSQFEYKYIGLENHLNYIYKPLGDFTETELLGLTGFLSSKVFDTYFRITNGNTQVSATEIKSVKLPNSIQINEIGILLKNVSVLNHSSIDTIVNEVLEL